jgi:hypothetical protein
MHPYQDKPDQSFWRRFVSNQRWTSIDFVGEPKFKISQDDNVSTAGSCFAQHINNHMRRRGFTPYQTERANSLVVGDQELTSSYSMFSARYGNIYSSRQCVDLIRQSFGEVPLVEDIVLDNGRYYDLLRPNAIPGGFSTYEEAIEDRYYHLQKVREMFESSDVFIFTLGLTEIWQSTKSGHTYPICPGTARGYYSPDEHRFYNLTHSDVVVDLEYMISKLSEYNNNLKFIFTVSPVPLVATQTEKNVLSASMYSKAVLRAACGEICDRYANVQYFPSFEIISHVASFGQYLESDLREVSVRGVSHVMDCFFNAFYFPSQNSTKGVPENIERRKDIEGMFEAQCDEILNEFTKV